MSIASTNFWFIFLPFVIGLYFLLPAKRTMLYRNIYLLIVSMLFYAYGEPVRVFLIVIMTIATWLFGLMAKGKRNTKQGKWAVALVVIMNVSALFLYKYLSTIIFGVEYIFKTELPSLKLALPLGLSFFCFSSISYIVDVYRGKAGDESLFDVALYLSIFFKITQGPIVQYNQFKKDLNERVVTIDKFMDGVWRITWGLGKKIILAAGLGNIVSYAFTANFQTLPVTIAWLGALAYMFQLYFDFSGYSDIAIGLGKLFGFETPENFNYPYAATSVTEYWQRWHKTLGEWFRDYLYYPLTLGPAIKIRKKLSKNHSKAFCKFIINLFTLSIIWFATSVWHGKSINYLVWGLINGGVSLLELYKKPLKNQKLDKAIGWTYTFLIALFVKTLTNLPTLAAAGDYYGAMFGLNGNAFTHEYFNLLISDSLVVLVASILFAFPFFKIILEKIEKSNKKWLIIVSKTVMAVFAVVIFIVSISIMQKTGYTDFMYQQF